MKGPLVIEHDRLRLIYSGNALRLGPHSGDCFLMLLTDAEKIELEAALRNSRRVNKRCGDG